MGKNTYKHSCVKCSVEFSSHSPASKYCKKCCPYYVKSYQYSKLFYKNRLIVLKRDLYRCQCCGSGGDGKQLNIHHLDCNKENNSMSNLISLCSQCHMSLHQKYDKKTLRENNIYNLFAKDIQFGEFGKTLIYEPAKQLVKKQFTGKPKLFFKTKKK